MNRRTMDIVLPGLYVVAVLITVFAFPGRAVAAVAAIGGVLLGMYWAGLRRNLRG